MNGIPRIQEVRSFSQFGLSGVTIVFDEGTDIYWARQQVGERLAVVRSSIPSEFGQPELGPIATGLGEILQFEVRNAPDAPRPKTLMELRTILDWDVARPLKSVPGVVEVNAFGGDLKTYEVRLDPERLMARGISVNRVFQAIRQNNSNAGGGYLERLGEQRVIRAVGLVSSLEDLAEIVLDTTPAGTPVYIRDVAEVRFAPMIRNGAVTKDGKGEAVTATVMMLAGENSRTVVEEVKAKLEQIRPRLPEGVVVDSYYDRAVLISRTITTVASNLAEGGILVVAVLLALLGNLKAGLVVALDDPPVDALRRQPDGLLRDRRQSHEPGGDRLRSDRRLERHHDGELRRPPGARRQAPQRGRRRPRGGARGPQAGRLRRGDHHDRPPAALGPGRGRGEDVPADGPDRRLRADWLPAAELDGDARSGFVHPQARRVGDRDAADPPGQVDLQAGLEMGHRPSRAGGSRLAGDVRRDPPRRPQPGGGVHPQT